MESLDLLRLHCKFFDFVTAKALADQIFSDLMRQQAESRDLWIDFTPAAIRVYSEMNSEQELTALKQKVINLDLVAPRLSSILSLKGRVALSNKDLPSAEHFFEAAVSKSLNDSELERANFGIGMISIYKGENRIAQKIFQEIVDSSFVIETKIASMGMLAQALNAMQETTQALSLLEEAKTMARKDRNHYLWIQTLIAEIEIVLLLGDVVKAQELLALVASLLPIDFIGFTHGRLRNLRVKLNSVLATDGFELVETTGRVMLKTPDRRTLDFTNQSLLISLLNILSALPRRNIGKEEIYQSLWGNPYHPLECDNKIYVTIRRLRVALGDSTEKPRYILKNNDGYILNPEFQFTSFQYKYFAKDSETR